MFKKLSITIVAGLILVGASSPVFASSEGTSNAVKNEDGSYSIKKPLFTYGTSLTDSELNETKSIFGITEDSLKSTDSYKITGDDLVKWLPSLGFTSSSGVWSSSYIVPADSGSGVHVVIKTPANITYYTEAQYRNAATTFGLTDAAIYIGSAKKVDGSGAMAGIFTAVETELPQNGNAQENAQVAQQELQTIGKISNENKDVSGYSDDKFNKALASMKTELQDESNKGTSTLTTDQIKAIINKELKANKLDGLVTDDQINQLADYLNTFQNSSAIKNEKLEEQLDALKKSVSEKASDVMKKAKDLYNSDEAKGILAKISEAFSNFIQSIKDLVDK